VVSGYVSELTHLPGTRAGEGARMGDASAAEWPQSCPEVGGTAGAGGDPRPPCLPPWGVHGCPRSGFAAEEEVQCAASCERSQRPVAHEQPSAHPAASGTSHRADVRLPRVLLRHSWGRCHRRRPELGRRRPLCSSVPAALRWRCGGEA